MFFSLEIRRVGNVQRVDVGHEPPRANIIVFCWSCSDDDSQLTRVRRCLDRLGALETTPYLQRGSGHGETSRIMYKQPLILPCTSCRLSRCRGYRVLYVVQSFYWHIVTKQLHGRKHDGRRLLTNGFSLLRLQVEQECKLPETIDLVPQAVCSSRLNTPQHMTTRCHPTTHT